jgi:N-acetylglucosaminyldiphosphoundecaprenol N-acetyl-beta-D-mannosaminyltransferase
MSVTVGGVRLDRLSEADTVAHVIGALGRGVGGWICPVNLDVLRQLSASPQTRCLVEEADLVVADGMPLIWASRLRGDPLPERVAGSSLIHSLCEAAADKRRSVFLLGGNPGVAEAAAVRLREASPSLRIAGTLCPPMGFEDDPALLASIDEAILASQPDLVVVGLGFPKQEQLVRRLRPLLPYAWFLSCGVTLSFVSGDLKRAPESLQRLGLEWLHRLWQEPRRLYRRYVIHGLPFLARLLAASLAQRTADAVGRGRPAAGRYRL